jgi:hypothetical protein
MASQREQSCSKFVQCTTACCLFQLAQSWSPETQLAPLWSPEITHGLARSACLGSIPLGVHGQQAASTTTGHPELN